MNSLKGAEKSNSDNLFIPSMTFSPMAMHSLSEDVKQTGFNKHEMFDLSLNDIKSISRATSPIFITQDWDDQSNAANMPNDIFKALYDKNSILSSGGSTVMNTEESLDDILSYNFNIDNTYSQDLIDDDISTNMNQTPLNVEFATTNIAPSALMSKTFSNPQELYEKSMSMSLGTTIMQEYETLNTSKFNNDNLDLGLLKNSINLSDSVFEDKKVTKPSVRTKKGKKKLTENQQEDETIRVQKVFNTKGKSISDSRLSTESLRQSFQLSSATAANKLEEFIEKLLVDHCSFQLGYRTWVRDTEKDEREEILNVLEFQLDKNMDYVYEITGLNKKLEKRSIETIVRKCTYAKQQSRLRKERRKAAQKTPKPSSDLL